jgi:hypothetical protein
MTGAILAIIFSAGSGVISVIPVGVVPGLLVYAAGVIVGVLVALLLELVLLAFVGVLVGVLVE